MPVGTIKSYNVHKGWGFVVHNGKDVFVQHKELKGRVPSEGDKISFTLAQAEQGAQATKITVQGPKAGAKYKGEIKSYGWTKGWGFISSEAFPGEDIFFLRHNVSEQAQEAIHPGAWCTFKLGEDASRGKQAEDVWFVGHAGNAVSKGGGGKGKGKGGGGGTWINTDSIDVGQLLGALLGGQGGGGGGVWKQNFQKKGKGKGKR